MKMRTFLSTLGIAMMGFMMTGVVASAQGRSFGGNRGERAGQVEKLADKLNLTTEQKQQIKALREQFQTSNASTLAEIKALREQMKTLREQKNREQMKGLREQMKTKMEALRPAQEQLQAGISAVLTAEQKAQLEGMKTQRRENRGERRGRR